MAQAVQVVEEPVPAFRYPKAHSVQVLSAAFMYPGSHFSHFGVKVEE